MLDMWKNTISTMNGVSFGNLTYGDGDSSGIISEVKVEPVKKELSIDKFSDPFLNYPGSKSFYDKIMKDGVAALEKVNPINHAKTQADDLPY